MTRPAARPWSPSRRGALACAVAALAAPALAAAPARAQEETSSWEDPTLAQAVAEADLVVVGRATAIGRAGAVYEVLTTLKGPARARVGVGGLELPGADGEGGEGGGPVPAGDVAVLILRGDPQGEVLVVPTPTFGRFPVRRFGGECVVAPIADTWVRVPIPRARFEALVRALVAGAAGPELLAEARAGLEQGPLDVADVYVGLEVLALFGGPADAPAIERVLDRADWSDPRRFQVRVAACRALGRAGGPRAVERLLGLVERDPVDAVRSAAAQALAGPLRALAGAPDGGAPVRVACERLAAAALEASSAPVRLGAVTDPRRNEAPGPLPAILRTLALVRAQAGVAPALRALERPEDGDALVAGLAYFAALGDPAHALAIAQRMRRPDAEDVFFNRMFARTLEGLTGQKLGDAREAWLTWCRDRALGVDGPARQGPPAPGGDEGGGR